VLNGVYLEDLCYDAQQAAEKAIKALLIHLRVRYPYTHDLAQLLTLIEQSGQSVPGDIKRSAALSDYAVETRYPGDIKRSAALSDYAVETRYPGLAEPVTDEEYHEAVTMAEKVVVWVENTIKD